MALAGFRGRRQAAGVVHGGGALLVCVCGLHVRFRLHVYIAQN